MTTKDSMIPTEGMEVDRTMLRSALIRQRPQIVATRDAAVIACAVDPAGWYAVNQVTLKAYLERLDRLEALSAQAEAEATGA